MKKTVFSMLVLILLGFSGCQKQTTPEPSRLVTQVDISCQKEDVQILRHYTCQEKMEAVLLYLRLAQTGKTVDAPGIVSGELYRICVTRADGSATCYQQRDHRYFCKEHHPWQELEAQQAEGLYRLLRQLPSDRI